MSTTLTNGLKLPDKGSVDWYADMQNNYNILDGAVGTVAEHTTALSGKAPLVHTHGKADVTDLFNSANTWTSLNTYNGMLLLKSSSDVAEQFKQKLPKDVSVSTDALVRFNTLTDSEDHNVIVEALGHWTNYVSKSVTLKYKNDSTKQGVIDFRLESNGSGLFYPQSPFECYLGNSSNQWKSVYAQSYYYNGVAWGLDKVNTWTAQQKIVGSNSRGTISIYNPAYTKGGTLSVTDLSIGSIYMGDGGQTGLANSLTFISTDLAANGAKTLLSLSAMENTTSSGTRTNVVIQYDKNDAENPKKVSFGGAVLPNPDATFSLGTPSFRWKTLNGVNPGALSLPDYNRFEPIDFSQWNVNLGFGNTYTPSEDGWLYGEIADTATNSIYLYSAGLQPVQSVNRKYGISAQGNGSQSGYGGRLAIMIPVRKGIQYRFLIKASAVSDIYAVIFYPCLGNV